MSGGVPSPNVTVSTAAHAIVPGAPASGASAGARALQQTHGAGVTGDRAAVPSSPLTHICMFTALRTLLSKTAVSVHFSK